MPFISEELYQAMTDREKGSTIMFARTRAARPYDASLIDRMEIAEEVVNGVRAIRQQKNLSPKEALSVSVKGGFPSEIAPAIVKLANVSGISETGDFTGKTGVSFMVRTIEIFVALDGLVDSSEEIAKVEAALEYQERFLAAVRKKLSNEAFVSHAPQAVVNMERKKEADSLSKIESYKSQLKALKGN